MTPGRKGQVARAEKCSPWKVCRGQVADVAASWDRLSECPADLRPLSCPAFPGLCDMRVGHLPGACLSQAATLSVSTLGLSLGCCNKNNTDWGDLNSKQLTTILDAVSPGSR